MLISQLIETISHMESRLPLDKNEFEIWQKSKVDLDELINEETQSMIFRCGANWMEYGEKNTKYFYNLERTKYNSKNCSALLDSNNVLKTQTTDILDMQKEFYSTLYQSDPEIHFEMENHTGILVDEKEFALQNKDLEINEMTNAVKSLKRIKRQDRMV